MPTVKKLQFANGTVITAPQDLTLETATNTLPVFENDGEYDAAYDVIEGSIYLSSSLKAPRLYLGGAWRTGIVQQDPADATKTVSFDLVGCSAGADNVLDFNSTADRTYTFPDVSATVVLTLGAQELQDKTIKNGFLDGTKIRNGALDVEAAGNVSIGTSTGANTMTLGGATSTVSIPGNLTVSGTTTTVDTVNLDVKDKNILVNKGGNDALSEGSGLTVDRTGTKGSLIYKATAPNKFAVGDLGSEKNIAAIDDITTANLSGTIPPSKGGTGVANSDAATLTRLGPYALTLTTTDTTSVTLPTSGTLATRAGTEDLSNKTLVEPIVDNFVAFNEEVAGPVTVASGKVAVYAKQDGKIYKKDDTQTETEIGSGGGGSGGKNYLEDWYEGITAPIVSVTTIAATGTRASDQNLWARSTDGYLTIEANTVDPLRATGDYKINSQAINGSAFVESPLFKLDKIDKAETMLVQFDVLNPFSTSTGYDFVIVRYNSAGVHQQIIPIPGDNLSTGSIVPGSAQLPGGLAKFKSYFIPSGTETDLYALRIRKISPAIDFDFQIDSLFIGPQEFIQGAVISDWQSYNPTSSGFSAGTNPSIKVSYRRIGTDIHVIGQYVAGGTGVAASGEFAIALPSGLSFDLTKISVSEQAIGSMHFLNTGIYRYGGTVVASNATDFRFSVRNTSTNGNFLSNTQPEASWWNAAGDSFSFEFMAPISQWTSGTTTLANRALEEYAWNSSATATSDTTSFGNGPDGVNIRSFSPIGVNTIQKRVRFQTPILSTDRISLEYNSGSGWGLAADLLGSTMSNDANTLSYGQYIRPVSGSNTDFDVLFCSAANGGTPWSGLTAWKWRVRKVSSGASVGYPIDSKNVIYKEAINTGTGVSTGDVSIKIGSERTGSGNSYLNLHSQVSTISVPYSARMVRFSGANGDCSIDNSGSGSFLITTNGVERFRFSTASLELRNTSGINYIGLGGVGSGNAMAFKWSSPNVIARIDNSVDVTLANVSDYRIKRDVETQSQPALERIAQLRPITYKMADYGELFKASEETHEGFLAHELQEIVPSSVVGKKDDPDQIQSLNLGALCSVMVKAIQELKQELEEAKAEIAALKAK
jgi:hypothetical protein